MNAWFALTKKEFRLGLPAFLFAVFLYGGFLSMAYWMGRMIGFNGEVVMIRVALIFILIFHIFFLFFYMIYSLTYERKRLHLWLHNPMPISGLILSKLASGIVYAAITFTVFLTAAHLLQKNNYDFISEQTMFNITGISTIWIFSAGITLAILFTFFWAIYLTLGQWMNDFFSFIVTIILFFLSAWLYESFTHLPFMQALTDWGTIQIEDVIIGFEFMITEDAFKAGMDMDTSLFKIGDMVRDMIMTIILFFAACWIIDKKVEV